MIIERRREFLCAYHAAYRKYRAGIRNVIFPAGTWAMRIRFRVRCHAAPRTLARAP